MNASLFIIKTKNKVQTIFKCVLCSFIKKSVLCNFSLLGSSYFSKKIHQRFNLFITIQFEKRQSICYLTNKTVFYFILETQFDTTCYFGYYK